MPSLPTIASNTILLASSLLLSMTGSYAGAADKAKVEKQFIELRYYHMKSGEAAQKADEYLINALVPALNRLGSKAVGVFREEAEQPEPLRLVVIAHQTVGDFAACGQKLAADEAYQAAAADYMSMSNKATPLIRIRTELLESFDCWPKLKVPADSKLDERIFELRIYESANQRTGNLKVEMFNAGEVPIFLDSGVMPVFMGQAIAGDKMPNLTYMTVYPNQAAKDKGWETFRKHPDWQVLSKVQKYKGSVSKIHKINLVPVTGSQL